MTHSDHSAPRDVPPLGHNLENRLSPEEYAEERRRESQERLQQFHREEAERAQRSRGFRGVHHRVGVMNDTQPTMGRSPGWIITAFVLALLMFLMTRACGDDERPRAASVAPGAKVTATRTVAVTPPRPVSYAESVRRITRRLNLSASKLSGPLAAASVVGDVARVRRAARSQLGLLNVLNADLANLTPPAPLVHAHNGLMDAVRAHRAYLATLVRTTSGRPVDGLRQLDAARTQGEAVLERYRTFYSDAGRPPGVRDGVVPAGIAHLDGLRNALRDARDVQPGRPVPDSYLPASRPQATSTQRPPARTTPAPPAAPPAPVRGPVTDYIARSTGSVNYRFSPSWDDVDRNEGPKEGAYVTIECFVRGERVEGNVWWARLDTGRYVPAYYLHKSELGPPDGSPIC